MSVCCAVIVGFVSAGIVIGFFICTSYEFLILVFSSVSLEYVRRGKCNSPWVTSSMALFFLMHVRPRMGPVIRSAKVNVSLKIPSPISIRSIMVLVGVSMSPLPTGSLNGGDSISLTMSLGDIFFILL